MARSAASVMQDAADFLMTSCGEIWVMVATKGKGVVLPPNVASVQGVTSLQISPYHARPCRNLDIGPKGLAVTLSFGGHLHDCEMPWDQVGAVSVQTDDGHLRGIQRTPRTGALFVDWDPLLQHFAAQQDTPAVPLDAYAELDRLARSATAQRVLDDSEIRRARAAGKPERPKLRLIQGGKK